jgi:hypothetical protein
VSCFNALKQGVLAAALLTALPVAAKTLTVTGVGEPATISSASCPANICPTLRDAINAAASGDTIMFGNAINGKTILLSLSSNDISAGSIEFGASAFFVTDGLGETVGKSLTIDGTSHGVTIARDAAATPFRLFDVGSKSSLGLRGLTLRNGLAQGGNSKGGGGALGAGGAIFNQGALAIDACALVGNSAQGGSGAIGTGSANGGGGAGQDATSADGGGPNGGMAGSPPRGAGFGGGGGTTLSATDPGGNGGFGGGGGKGGSGIGGGTGGFGGGGGSDAFLPGNGGFGGGVAGGDFDHVPNGGGGGGMGGAIFNDAGTVTLTNTTFYENSATGGNTTYGGTAVAGGNGSGFGGAIFNYAGTLSASFVTLAGNSTATGTGGAGGGTDGGAIYSHADSACGTSDGNICTTGDADLSMVNSVAARSVGSAHDIVVDNSGGTSASNGSGNLIMTQSGFAGTFISSDPKLGALSPYAAGPAPATLPISAASPAYNAAASCNDAKNQTVVNDQRGKSRPLAGTCDIGAYEFDNDYIYANSYE